MDDRSALTRFLTMVTDASAGTVAIRWLAFREPAFQWSRHRGDAIGDVGALCYHPVDPGG